MNEITRMEYVKDCNVGLTRWNMGIKRSGVDFEFALPSIRFRRMVGSWAVAHTDPDRKAHRSARQSLRRKKTSGCQPMPINLLFTA